MYLVIGYGNELRRDDGVGPRVARTVAAWGVPGVLAVALPQLTPELAEAVAGASEVFFVDASAGNDTGVRVRPVRPEVEQPLLGHTSSPPALLALAEVLYGRRPRAWLVTVPAPDLDFGEELSSAAARGMDEALSYLRRHVGTTSRTRTGRRPS
ncbi:MAG TPA: hydrogenase maturation protease [Candidatus Baltobacteraceae bacterium]|nr:hydrogenase maturation protease [Gemmataceae bacterium]HXR27359.1 hydrogenase maturation protease [Candidatus Baltobacteraceae bacterium]